MRRARLFLIKCSFQGLGSVRVCGKTTNTSANWKFMEVRARIVALILFQLTWNRQPTRRDATPSRLLPAYFTLSLERFCNCQLIVLNNFISMNDLFFISENLFIFILDFSLCQICVSATASLTGEMKISCVTFIFRLWGRKLIIEVYFKSIL